MGRLELRHHQGKARKISLSWVICSGVFLLALMGGAREGLGAPMSASRVGGLNFSSPVEGMVTSIYWNPAALGLTRGTHVFVDGTLRLTRLEMNRHSIDPSTGMPASGPGVVSFDKETLLSMTPDAFFGFATDLGSDSVVLGVAVYTPFAELDRFPGSKVPGDDASQRYHRVSVDWFNIFISPVVSVKFHRRFYVGVGLTYVRSILNMSFYRDRTIRETYKPGNEDDYVVEDPMRGERVSIEAADNSVTFNLGVLVILPGEVSVGLAYRSKALGLERSNVEASGKVTVTRHDESEGGWKDVSGRAKVYYVLPDSLSLGVGWSPHKKWELDLNLEWVHFSVHKNIHFKFSGNQFRAANMGNWDVNFKHYRGFEDVWRIHAGAAYRPLENLRLGGSVGFESAATEEKWVNAAAVDAHKAEFLLTLEWYPHKSVSLHLGYGLTLMPRVDVGSSGYNPSRTTACVTNQVDIVWNDDCDYVDSGKGLPTAAGSYWKMVHRVGLGVGYHYQ